MILSRLSRQAERCGPKNRGRDEKDTDIRSREAPAPRITISCYSTVYTSFQTCLDSGSWIIDFELQCGQS